MNIHKSRIYAGIVIAVLCLVIVYLGFLLAREYQNVRTARTDYSMRQKVLTADDVSRIAPWMTFDFINRAFSLPPDYLRTNLQITDARYPNITLQAYAKMSNTALAILLENVQAQVGAYLTAHP